MTANTTTTSNAYGTILRTEDTLVVWPHHLNEHADQFVIRARNMLDGERVSSLTSLLATHSRDFKATQEDVDLSTQGKRKQFDRINASAWNLLPGHVREYMLMSAEHRRDMTAAHASAVPEAKNTADVMIDLELGRQLLANKPIATVLELQASERVKIAIGRLPEELTGVTPEVKARVVGSLIDHETALRLENHETALGKVHHVLQAAINKLSPTSGLSPAQKREHLGCGDAFRV